MPERKYFLKIAGIDEVGTVPFTPEWVESLKDYLARINREKTVCEFVDQDGLPYQKREKVVYQTKP